MPPRRPGSGTKTIVCPITFFRQDSGIEEIIFLHHEPMGYYPKSGAGAKVGGFQVNDVSGFQVSDGKDVECCGRKVRHPKAGRPL